MTDIRRGDTATPFQTIISNGYTSTRISAGVIQWRANLLAVTLVKPYDSGIHHLQTLYTVSCADNNLIAWSLCMTV